MDFAVFVGYYVRFCDEWKKVEGEMPRGKIIIEEVLSFQARMKPI
jgi:hypothetical protein